MVTISSFNTADSKDQYVAEIDSITGLTVYEFVEQKPMYTGARKDNCSHETSLWWFLFDVINSVDDDSISSTEMIPKLDITIIIDDNGNIVGERFSQKKINELNRFQQEFLKNISKQKKWIPGKIKGQNVNTKLRVVVRLSPNR